MLGSTNMLNKTIPRFAACLHPTNWTGWQSFLWCDGIFLWMADCSDCWAMIHWEGFQEGPATALNRSTCQLRMKMWSMIHGVLLSTISSRQFLIQASHSSCLPPKTTLSLSLSAEGSHSEDFSRSGENSMEVITWTDLTSGFRLEGFERFCGFPFDGKMNMGLSKVRLASFSKMIMFLFYDCWERSTVRYFYEHSCASVFLQSIYNEFVYRSGTMWSIWNLACVPLSFRLKFQGFWSKHLLHDRETSWDTAQILWIRSLNPWKMTNAPQFHVSYCII